MVQNCCVYLCHNKAVKGTSLSFHSLPFIIDTEMQRLSEEVKSLIRTGVALPSVTQVVEELLLNSVDAGASNIAVRVDLSCFKIQVVDNGHGITEDHFELVGERYATSKCHSAKDLECLKHYGYRGEALSSIKNTSSFLEITSRPRGSSITFSKCFHQGKQSLVTKLPSCRPSVGTTIPVHDLFYNLPVRQSKANFAIEMEKIRYRVFGLALIWPSITISLRNDSLGQILLQTKKCNSSLGVFCNLFPTARLNDLMEMDLERDDLSIWGFISRESHSQKDVQFVYINKRLVLNSCIHKLVNRILGHSLITKRRDQSLGDILPTSGSPSKNVDSYGVFLLNISCPFNFYDITFDPQKTLVEFSKYKKLSDLIQDVIYDLLRRENLIYNESCTLKSNPEQAEESSNEVQLTSSLQLDDEQCGKIRCVGISISGHSDILCSKPVKKCSKNLLQSFDDPSSLLNKNDKNLSRKEEIESASVLESTTDKNQSDVLKNQVDDISRMEFSNSDEIIDNNRDCDVSSSGQQNISDEISAEKSGNKHSRPEMKNRQFRKSNKPELSKIAMDKSVKYVSTLSCLREFSAPKRGQCSTNMDTSDRNSTTVHNVKNINTLTEVRNATKPSENVHNVRRINTLTELKNATRRPFANAEDVTTTDTLMTELKNATELTANVDDNVPRVNTLTELKKFSKSSANGKYMANINTLTELKNATASENLDNVQIIHTFAHVNDMPRINSSAQPKNTTKPSTRGYDVPRIDTLNELKKATQSSIDVNTLLQTPSNCNSNENMPSKIDVLNSWKQNRLDGVQESAILKRFSETHTPLISYSRTNEFDTETSHHENIVKNSNSFSCEKGKEKTVQNDQGITGKIIGTDGDKSKDKVLPNSPNLRDEMMCFEDTEIPDLLPNSFINLIMGNVSNNNDQDYPSANVGVNPVSWIYVPRDNTSCRVENVSTEFNENHHNHEMFSSRSDDVETTTNSHTSQSSPVVSFKSNHTSNHKLQLDFPTSSHKMPDSFQSHTSQSQISPGNDLQDQSDNVMINENHDSIPVSHNSILSPTHSIIPFQSKPGFPCPSSSSGSFQERNILNNGDVVEIKKTDEKRDSKMLSVEAFEIASEVVAAGKFNLKSLMGQETTRGLNSLHLISRKKISSNEVDKQFKLNILLTLYPNSGGRKRKLVGNIELSAGISSPKKFHCRFFENDSDLSDNNFFFNSMILKKFVRCYINRPGLGLYNKSSIPTSILDVDTRSPRHVLDPAMFISNDSFIKSSYKSIFALKFNSAQIKHISNSDLISNLERSKVKAGRVIQKYEVENLIDDETCGNISLCQDGRVETTITNDSFNFLCNPINGGEINFRTSLCDLDMRGNEVDNLYGNVDLETGQTSPNKSTKLSAGEMPTVSAKDFYSAPSKCLVIDLWKNPVFKKHKLVIGQVEMKFIACLIEKPNLSSDNSERSLTLLVLFDQHAVHERIRLETLTSDAEEMDEDSGSKRLKRARINPPVALPVNKDDARIVKAFQTEFQRIGVEFQLGESAQSMQSIVIQSLPVCMTQRDLDGKQRDDEEISKNAKDLIQEHIQHLKATNGVHGRIPLAVHRVLCSQACRGAIKFGDPVSLARCRQLMTQLSECSLPFQCAHGRPSVVPLVNLKTLENHNQRVMMKPRLRQLSADFRHQNDVTMK